MSEIIEIPKQGEISAGVTPWFFRRMVYMALIFLGFGAHFYYDGTWGYPNENGIFTTKTRMLEVRGDWEKAKLDGKLEEWMLEAKKSGKLPLAAEEPSTWEGYATASGLGTDPKFHSEDKIREQFHFAWGCFVIGAIPVILIVKNLGRKVYATDAGVKLAGGRDWIPFSEIRLVDKRKWENKGLAYIEYSRDPEGNRSRGKLDCLKYQTHTMEEVLRRILAHFSGELIEKVFVDDGEEDGAVPTGSGPIASPDGVKGDL